MNWINSWKSNKKKNLSRLEFRVGKLTLVEIELYPPYKKCKQCAKVCGKTCKKRPRVRVMLFNFGFEA
jgi:hypothetical protein